MKQGRFTLPGESGMEKEIAQLVNLWGADAIRDSDGTVLSEELIDMGLQVYSTICLVRMDNEYAKAHKEFLQQMYLSSDEHLATNTKLVIDVMEDAFAEQFEPNTDVDIKKYWQVMDRTANKPIDSASWSYKDGKVTVENPVLWHNYSVTFLARQLWEPVSMYNHITNGWQEEHKMPVDPVYPESRQNMLKKLEDWLINHPKTDVVRFTTFFYNFDYIYNKAGKEKYVNWFGYAACVSPRMMEMFKEKYGYEMEPEDFIDNYQYNTPFKNPTEKFKIWMDFVGEFVSGLAKECVDLVHKYNKKAIMFLGDHWAGTEPYGKHFHKIGLDAVVGAAGDGVTTRMITDIPVKETEARFYPYLFPDIFCEGGDPVGESKPIWVKCRRALIRNSAARMGYGGYISLALKFPDFIEHVTDIVNQFNSIHDETCGTKAYAYPFKVAVLNSWGNIRAWQCHQVAHSLWRQFCYSYLGVLEALAGLPVEVSFISFDDIKEKGIPEDVGVIVNCGDRDTSWSGGEYWLDEDIVTKIRKWVYNGGGFIGVGEPTACAKDGKLFALSDVLGVQKELGLTGSLVKPEIEINKEHFITANAEGFDYGEGMNFIYKSEKTTNVLDAVNMSTTLTANEYGNGRAVYMAGLPFNASNSRLLHRALCWSAGKEDEYEKYSVSNVNAEIHVFPEVNKCCITNNSDEIIKTEVNINTAKTEITLNPLECRWIEIR